MVRIGGKHRHLIEPRPCRCCDPALGAFTQRANADLSRRGFLLGAGAAAAFGAGFSTTPALAQGTQPKAILFEDVRIFDGAADELSSPSNVLIVGNIIKSISTAAIDAPPGVALTRIRGAGRTLTPGLIDGRCRQECGWNLRGAAPAN